MLANYLIGLREGLEASLVVSILVAYLVKTGHRARLPQIWAGVAAAVGLSLAFGALLSFSSSQLSTEQQEGFGGVMSILAVVFVTWMIFWMRRTARFMKTQLQGKVDAALAMGTVALVLTSFIAVAREGLETSVFIWSTVETSSRTTGPLLGAALGILTAVVLAYLLYRRAVAINLARFFTWTGVGLVVVAAGVLSYGFHDLQEAGLIPGLDTIAFDVSATIAPDSWYGSVLKGIFNFSPRSTWVEVVVWSAYIVPVMSLFLRPGRKPVAATPGPRQPAPASR